MSNENTNEPKSQTKDGYVNKPTGIKSDDGKPIVFKGVLALFPRAVEAVSAVSSFGSNKYSWDNWKYVDNGVDRYTEALVRHLLAEGKGQIFDSESGFSHATHTAWNALARLELIIAAQKDKL